MQLEVSEPAAAALGRRPAQQQFAGVDLRRPKGYAAPTSPAGAAAPASQEAAPAAAAAAEGDPCPRCESRDTKFCYYNNYNTSQPRHFCKGCRRYWTKGGTLRNVPVGGGTRKKPSSSSSLSPPSSYAAAAKPKRPYKKKRRVAPPEPSAPASTAAVSAPTADSAKPAPTETTTTAATTPATDAASETTAELVVPAAEDDSYANLLHADDAVALGLGLSDLPSGKSAAAFLEPDSFEWPASLDLGAYWGGGAGAFADSDPAIFLNLP